MTTIANATPYVYTTYQTYGNIKNTEETTDNKEPKYLQEHKMIAPNQVMRSLKMPKPSSIKNFMQKMEEKFEQWIEKYNSRPHEYDIDSWQENADMILDITDNTAALPDDKNNYQYINVNV